MEFVAVPTPKVEKANQSFSSMSIWHRRFGRALFERYSENG